MAAGGVTLRGQEKTEGKEAAGGSRAISESAAQHLPCAQLWALGWGIRKRKTPESLMSELGPE